MASNSVGILNSALQANKRKMDLAMQNIANADNEIYSAKKLDVSSIVIDNSPQGVRLEAIRNRGDELLQRSLNKAIALSSSSQYVSDVCKEITDELAKPGRNESLFDRLNMFSDAINSLSFNPTSVSHRNDLQDKANNLSNYISSFAVSLQNKRYEADQNLAKAIQEVNGILSKLHHFNSKRLLTSTGTLEYCHISDQIENELKNLSQYFDINSTVDSNGLLRVCIKNNGHEVVGSQMHCFEYKPAQNVNTFINDDELNPVYLVSRSLNGRSETRTLFIDGYKSSNLSYNFSGGLMNGYLEVRDDIIPRVSETIDQIAVNIVDSFNKVHNKGVSSNATLNGSTALTLSDKILGNGTITINPTDNAGKPMVSGSYGKIPALKLNLSEFSTHGINGSFSAAGLIDEINRYFEIASTGNRLDINGFHTIQLASRSSTAGSLELDFDLIGYSKTSGISDVEFTLMNVSATDSFGSNIGVTTSGTANLVMESGEFKRTGVNGGPIIKLANTATDYPITVSVDIKTTVNGIDTMATVEYVLNAPLISENLVNKRFAPTSSVGVPMLQGGYAKPIIKASLVNSKGSIITDENTQGFLKIENTIMSGAIAIDENDSRIVSTTNQDIAGGFSYALGLNDAFVFKKNNECIGDTANIKNIAAYMQLNDNIQRFANSFAIGKMQAYRAGENSTVGSLFFAVGAGDTSLMSDYQKISTTNIEFSKTADIDSRFATIYDYASDIISANNIRTINQNIIAEKNNMHKEMIANDLAGIQGVNIDDEAIATIQYQKNYTIAAKFINTANTLLQTLIDNM